MSSPPEAVVGKDWNKDFLQMFRSGESYDCTFKVGRRSGRQIGLQGKNPLQSHRVSMM